MIKFLILIFPKVAGFILLVPNIVVRQAIFFCDCTRLAVSAIVENMPFFAYSCIHTSIHAFRICYFHIKATKTDSTAKMVSNCHTKQKISPNMVITEFQSVLSASVSGIERVFICINTSKYKKNKLQIKKIQHTLIILLLPQSIKQSKEQKRTKGYIL